MKIQRYITLLILGLLVTIASACRQTETVNADNINVDVTVTDSLVGETSILVIVTDNDGNPITNAGKLTLRGDMSHAGMTPVIRESETSNQGVFNVPFEWTMGGSWTLEATLTLPDGGIYSESFNYEILTEASEEDMGDMGDMENMDSTDHDMAGMVMGQTSAIYMRITNNGDKPVTVTGFNTSAANRVEIHQTIVEDGVARMQPITEIEIAAGATAELRPGGMHVMLMELNESLSEGDVLEVEVLVKRADPITVEAIVQEMLMEDIDALFERGDLTIENVWARPAASTGTMGSSE